MKSTIMKLGILILIICIFILIIVKKNYDKKEKVEIRNQKRYQEIKAEIEKEIEDYIYSMSPYCEKGGPSHIITHKDLVYNRGMKKEQFLDVDGKSYCRAYVLNECVEDGVWAWKVQIGCKDYEDEEFVGWDATFE